MPSEATPTSYLQFSTVIINKKKTCRWMQNLLQSVWGHAILFADRRALKDEQLFK
jgi:hypothetical protein